MINVIKIDVMFSSLNLKENIFYTDLFLQLLSSPLRETDDLDGHHEDDDNVGDGDGNGNCHTTNSLWASASAMISRYSGQPPVYHG